MKFAGICRNLSDPTMLGWVGLVTNDNVTNRFLQVITLTDLPGKGAVQDADEEGLGCVEGGEKVSQEEGRSRQEHQA